MIWKKPTNKSNSNWLQCFALQ